MLTDKYTNLLSTAQIHEKMASTSAIEAQHRSEEIRLLRSEKDQLNVANNQLKLNTQVELESLQEQLRLAKEKQYQLLERLQQSEENQQQTLDQMTGMEDKLRQSHNERMDYQTQLQVAQRNQHNIEDTNKLLNIDLDNTKTKNNELQLKIKTMENEKSIMLAESNDTSEQLMKMSEKVFQLLERMKLAELGKNKAIETLKKKEQEVISLKKKKFKINS